MNDNKTLICNWCGQQTLIIWVHGHGQCSVCGINIDECCRGEEVQTEKSEILNQQKEEND